MIKCQPISKKIRFHIFKRDTFKCQYCGKNPVDNNIILEIDHLISVKDGGDNSEENLITSCFDCNRGKGKTSVIKKIDKIEELEEEYQNIKERLEQIKYIKSIKKKIVMKKSILENSKYDFIRDIMSCYEGEPIYDAIFTRIKNHHTKYGYDINLAEDSLIITKEKFYSRSKFFNDDFIKYFHGVLNSKLSEDE